MKRKELIEFLEWVDKDTWFFSNKDVTVKQVVDEYLAKSAEWEKVKNLNNGVLRICAVRNNETLI